MDPVEALKYFAVAVPTALMMGVLVIWQLMF